LEKLGVDLELSYNSKSWRNLELIWSWHAHS
jgi:hypothetical protein